MKRHQHFATGNPHFYFDGTRRPGKNEMSNSVIAVDLNKKKILWSFQETAHDIWNSDLPAPPILTTINKNNKFYGNIFKGKYLDCGTLNGYIESGIEILKGK